MNFNLATIYRRGARMAAINMSAAPLLPDDSRPLAESWKRAAIADRNASASAFADWRNERMAIDKTGYQKGITKAIEPTFSVFIYLIRFSRLRSPSAAHFYSHFAARMKTIKVFAFIFISFDSIICHLFIASALRLQRFLSSKSDLFLIYLSIFIYICTFVFSESLCTLRSLLAEFNLLTTLCFPLRLSPYFPDRQACPLALAGRPAADAVIRRALEPLTITITIIITFSCFVDDDTQRHPTSAMACIVVRTRRNMERMKREMKMKSKMAIILGMSSYLYQEHRRSPDRMKDQQALYSLCVV